jgi:hypothetical protein
VASRAPAVGRSSYRRDPGACPGGVVHAVADAADLVAGRVGGA